MKLHSTGQQRVSVRMPQEIEFLICCIGMDISDTQAARFQALQREDLNWDDVMQLAMQHGVLPLLYWNVDHSDPASMPKAIWKELQTYFYANKLHNQRLTHYLIDLLDRFNARDITAVPFKGPALALAAYGNLDLRQFGDLDILVPERDCLAAMQILVSQGFRLKSPTLNVQEEMVQLSRCAYSFFCDTDDISVDLHWGITAAMEYPDRAFALPLDAVHVWERLEPTPLPGTEVLGFAPEDLLLVLCVHGSKHCWERLGWLCDIVKLINRYPDIAWPQIQACANRLGCRRMLDLGLALAHTMGGAGVPEPVWQQVQTDAVVRSLVEVVKWNWSTGTISEAGLVARSRFYLRMRERWRDKLQYGVLLSKMAVEGGLSKMRRGIT